MDFQSYSLSISYRISNVVHRGVWIFSGIAHYISIETLNRPTNKLFGNLQVKGLQNAGPKIKATVSLFIGLGQLFSFTSKVTLFGYLPQKNIFLLAWYFDQ